MKLSGIFAVLGIFVMAGAAQAECSYGAHVEEMVQTPIILLPPVDGEATVDS